MKAYLLDEDGTLHIRVKKLIGAVALIVFLTIYALSAMVFAITLQVNASKWIEVIYYIVAGLAWTIPAGAIIWWMQQPDGPPSGAKDP